MGKATICQHQSHSPQIFMVPVSAQGTINSHSIRNLTSLDKKLSLTLEVVEDEAFKLKFAQWLLMLPVDAVLRCSFEVVQD